MAKKKQNVYEAFFGALQKADEQVSFKFASETIGAKHPAIKTGSLILDDALSSDGLPKGRLTQYYGPPGSGKSLMSMLAIREAQLDDPKAKQLFIDAEQTFSSEWAETLGINTSKVMLIDGDLASDGVRCFEMLLGVPTKNKTTGKITKSSNGVLDEVTNGKMNINLIVLDSIGQIIPPKESEAKIGSHVISGMAGFLTKTFKKLSVELSRANVPMILINHKREVMDMYPDGGVKHTFTGGNTFAHTLSCNVYFEAKHSKADTIFNENNEKVGHLMIATVEKTKFGPWPRKCSFKVNFSEGVVDSEDEVVELAIKYGVIDRVSSMTYAFGDKKWVGAENTAKAIADDHQLRENIIDKIYKARDDKRAVLRTHQQIAKKNSLVDSEIIEVDEDEPEEPSVEVA